MCADVQRRDDAIAGVAQWYGDGAQAGLQFLVHQRVALVGHARQFAELLADVKNNSDGESARNVRIFTLAYGSGTDPAALRQIAEASNATAYQAGDATTINKVFAAVVSNF